MQTANGIAQGRRGRAEVIQLRSLLARDVQIVVPARDKDISGVDGLLGMSFLSRFNIKIDETSVRLSSRGVAQTEAKAPNIQSPFPPSLGVFRVFGVKQGDVLNVRERPNTDGKIVAQIPPDASNVEVHSCAADSSQRWCKVTYSGATGWANASYLRHLATGAPPQ
jgi:Bacterial SH3 domain